MPTELLPYIKRVRRALHGQLPGSVNSSAGQRLEREIRRVVQPYFGALEAALPTEAIAEMVRKRSPDFEGRRSISKPEWRLLQRDARIVVNDAIEGLSQTLFETIFPIVVVGHLVGSGSPIAPAEFAEAETGLTVDVDAPTLTASQEIKRLQAILVEYGGNEMKQVPLRVIQWAKAHCAESVVGMNAESKRRIAGVVARGIKEHAGADGTARMLGEAFGDMRKTRARLIANNEINTAMSQGAFERAVEEGQKTKHWLSVGDNKVTPGCQANEAVGKIGIDESFPSGHLRPPRFPNCRCVVAYGGGEQ